MTIDKKRKIVKLVEKFDPEQKSYILGVAHGIKAASGIRSIKT